MPGAKKLQPVSLKLIRFLLFFPFILTAVRVDAFATTFNVLTAPRMQRFQPNRRGRLAAGLQRLQVPMLHMRSGGGADELNQVAQISFK